MEWTELEENGNAGTSAVFSDRLRERHSGPLNVIWDNAPAHHGEAIWAVPAGAWPGTGTGYPAGLLPGLPCR